jgi:hypothetical protein
MNNSKLLEILSRLTPAEWAAFGHYVEGPEASFNSQLRQFYDRLHQYYDEKFASLIASREKCDEFFLNLGIDSKKVPYLVADMWTACKAFLISYHASGAVSECAVLGSELARDPGSKAYRSFFNETVRNRNRSGDSDFFFRQYLSELVHLEKVVSKSGRGEENNIEYVNRYLDLFYTSKKLQIMCEMYNLRNILNTKGDEHFNEEIIQSIEKGWYDDEPVVMIYYHVYRSLTDSDDENHFYTLRSLLGRHGEMFSRSELRDLYQYLMNYCIKKINTGKREWVKVLFDIYKEILANEVIYTDEKLSPWDFKNIVVIGLRSGEISWVHDFIEEKHKLIDPSERDNAYTYNRGYYYFFTKDYRKAIRLISQTEFTDLYYQLDYRTVLLKCYYEMGDVDGLLYFLPSFRMFLRRNRSISDYQRTIYSNLVKYTGKLVRYDGDTKKLEALSKEVDAVQNVADLNWLKEKISIAS